ncbi:type I restriction endonuclease subunit R [Brevifollis gellanilyticus]|uniref:Type I restriction enzyme endonuclease subunit n=1 Tax=Brevifollis gellanilyticus TaxID=748831 RepID=A0A512MHR0_9BACT|nr:type I restriction endonuclease subunit R [Brevifollis gellanilyticus]GEP45871.1 deoxyribonuclease [Brevifollis gellanilyticus]
MAYTDINSEDRLVQQTFAEHLEGVLGWDSVYAYKAETFGAEGTLGREDTREVVLTRDLRAALVKLNAALPDKAIDEAVSKMTRHDFSRSLLQHNQEFHGFIRDGVPVDYKDEKGHPRSARARVIDFADVTNNRFLAVRELCLTGLRAPSYNRRADLVCFVNGLPLVFIELKAVYRNIRAGFDGNLSDYMDEHVVGHAFHHNAFLIVSNGDNARYGSITSGWDHFAEWKRNDEKDKGKVNAQVLLDGMLAKDRLLDLVENFILFDASKAGKTRKVVARNHQVLGVNLAVESVMRQEVLKKEFPERRKVTYAAMKKPMRASDWTSTSEALLRTDGVLAEQAPADMPLVQRAHPELGRLGVFWHTQGSGKSYSMAFFTEKVRRKLKGAFTFVIMTDRDDLDSQIYRTFGGCGVIDPKKTPRASSGKELKTLLGENHAYIFTLIHKFNQEVDAREPYSERDDIIVISDEAHRTQAGKFARNMRQALPNAAFLGFTGTPLFKNDHLTKRIFGGYVSRYDFKRSEEDGATVKLVYENRGEKLGVAKLDLNDRIAEVIEQSNLDEDQQAHLENLLGKDYEVITAPDRLEKIAKDFVDHCSARWQAGKSMLVCIDKITCGRMFNMITPHWQAKTLEVKAAAESEPDADRRDVLNAKARWMEETIIEIQISEQQGEVKDFKKWGVDIIPHRERMKKGFEVGEETLSMEDAFKTPSHPFRVVIVCAMWLTGFDVESLSTLYIDKPMKAHTLMQAIARANRRCEGKDFGLIVDYNGMLKSLRAALAQYALGDDEEGGGGGGGGEEIVAPIEERVRALNEAIVATEAHLLGLGFDATKLIGAKGFTKTGLLADAVNAVYKSKESKQRFEIMARQVFLRFKALIMEEAIHAFAERHDNLEAIYKKLEERRDMSDVTGVLKELHLIVNEAIRAQAPGDDQTEAKTYDLSKIDMEKLRDEFAQKIKHKAIVVEDLRALIERKLALMMRANPQRMDYHRKYSEIVADYNREKDRVTIEDTFARLADLLSSLNEEQRRAAEEGLTEEELAIYDLMKKDKLTKRQRETVKEASKHLLARVLEVLALRHDWTAKETTKADVEQLIQVEVFSLLPDPPFDEDEKLALAGKVYQHVFQQSSSGVRGGKAA